jgi:tetratricopeptide (TPR) repeat protein
VRGAFFVLSLLMWVAVPIIAVPRTSDAASKNPEKTLELPEQVMSLSDVAEQQQTPTERAPLEAAIQLLNDEAYVPAAASLYAVSLENPELQNEAEYLLGKALYRLELYRSALHYFVEVVSRGPQTKFYNPALEWCLFIGRKTVDDSVVTGAIARYSVASFPKDYQDEFYFRLARYHYQRAIEIEDQQASSVSGKAQVKETDTGGKSLSGDIFGDDAVPDKKVETSKQGGRLTIEEDIFGFGNEAETEAKSKEKLEEGGELTPEEHVLLAERMALRVRPESVYGARAKFIEALILFKGQRENEALEAFKSVVRLTGPDQIGKSDRLRQLAFFQLGRTHFGAKQPSFARFYYQKIDRDSPSWLDAIYESSWSEFRLGDYEKSLGSLLTLHAPFFKDEYYPESLILKAVIYYENCRYKEASEILDAFLKRYEPVLGKLKELTGNASRTPKEFFEILANLRTPELASSGTSDAEILSQILVLALRDRAVARLDSSHSELSAEMDLARERIVGPNTDALAAKLLGQLDGDLTHLTEEAGLAVQRQLEQERSSIRTLIEQAIRIQIETSRAEQERIESRLRDARTLPGSEAKAFVEWTDDEHLVWPFEGEYWRDELGTYELTLARSCR